MEAFLSRNAEGLKNGPMKGPRKARD